MFKNKVYAENVHKTKDKTSLCSDSECGVFHNQHAGI